MDGRQEEAVDDFTKHMLMREMRIRITDAVMEVSVEMHLAGLYRDDDTRRKAALARSERAFRTHQRRTAALVRIAEWRR